MYKILLGSLIGLQRIVGSMFGMSGAFIIIPLLLLWCLFESIICTRDYFMYASSTYFNFCGIYLL